MNQEEMWSEYGTFIIGKAKEIHRMFPRTLELNEKISIAWTLANSARKTFDPAKSTFKTYAGVSIVRGLFKELKREYKARNYIPVDIDSVEKNDLSLDEKINSFFTITKSRGGYYAWLNKVGKFSIEEISEHTGHSRSKICRDIKKFQAFCRQ